MMSKLEHTGICVACFDPIRNEEPFRFRVNGRKFHKACAERRTGNYYVRLERRKGGKC